MRQRRLDEAEAPVWRGRREQHSSEQCASSDGGLFKEQNATPQGHDSEEGEERFDMEIGNVPEQCGMEGERSPAIRPVRVL